MVSTTILPGNWRLVDGCSYSNWSLPECIFRTQMVRPFSWECSQRTVFLWINYHLGSITISLRNVLLWVFPLKAAPVLTVMLFTFKSTMFNEHKRIKRHFLLQTLNWLHFMLVLLWLFLHVTYPELECSVEGIHHFYKIHLIKKGFFKHETLLNERLSSLACRTMTRWTNMTIYVETKAEQTDVRLIIMDPKLNVGSSRSTMTLMWSISTFSF